MCLAWWRLWPNSLTYLCCTHPSEWAYLLLESAGLSLCPTGPSALFLQALSAPSRVELGCFQSKEHCVCKYEPRVCFLEAPGASKDNSLELIRSDSLVICCHFNLWL